MIPYFRDTEGPSFVPCAGVPQGSVIGPILFITFVNDIPPTIYKDTIRTQYADDIITMVRATYKRKNKHKDVKNKMTKELENIIKWENKWKIKVNPNKSSVGCNTHHKKQLQKLGNIHINNTPLQYTNIINILGYNFKNDTNHTKHITITKKQSKSSTLQTIQI